MKTGALVRQPWVVVRQNTREVRQYSACGGSGALISRVKTLETVVWFVCSIKHIPWSMLLKAVASRELSESGPGDCGKWVSVHWATTFPCLCYSVLWLECLLHLCFTCFYYYYFESVLVAVTRVRISMMKSSNTLFKCKFVLCYVSVIDFLYSTVTEFERSLRKPCVT